MENKINNDREPSLVHLFISHTPKWTMGVVGSILSFGLVLMMLGVDFSSPFNNITSAYADAIKSNIDTKTKFFEAMEKMKLEFDKNNKIFIKEIEYATSGMVKVAEIQATRTDTIIRKQEDIFRILGDYQRKLDTIHDNQIKLEQRIKTIEDGHKK